MGPRPAAAPADSGARGPRLMLLAARHDPSADPPESARRTPDSDRPPDRDRSPRERRQIIARGLLVDPRACAERPRPSIEEPARRDAGARALLLSGAAGVLWPRSERMRDTAFHRADQASLQPEGPPSEADAAERAAQAATAAETPAPTPAAPDEAPRAEAEAEASPEAAAPNEAKPRPTSGPEPGPDGALDPAFEVVPVSESRLGPGPEARAGSAAVAGPAA